MEANVPAAEGHNICNRREISPKPSLCAARQSITMSALQSADGYHHLTSVWDLEGSTKACELCMLLLLAACKNIDHAGEPLHDLPIALLNKGLEPEDFPLYRIAAGKVQTAHPRKTKRLRHGHINPGTLEVICGTGYVWP